MKNIFKTLCVLAIVYAWMLSSNDGYELAKKQEQLVSEFWTASGDKHFSGSEE